MGRTSVGGGGRGRGDRKSLLHVSREYSISRYRAHVRVPGTIAPVPYREHSRTCTIIPSSPAGGSIKHRRLRGFILSNFARARAIILPGDKRRESRPRAAFRDADPLPPTLLLFLFLFLFSFFSLCLPLSLSFLFDVSRTLPCGPIDRVRYVFAKGALGKKKLKQENFLTLNYSGTKRIINKKFSNRMQNRSNDVKSSNVHSKTGKSWRMQCIARYFPPERE